MEKNQIIYGISSEEPLSDEMFLKYYELSKKGNEQAKEELIRHNIGIIIEQVEKKYNTLDINFDREDCFSIGLIALDKAIDTYDVSRKIKFSTYAYTCIGNAIYKHLQKELVHYNKSESLDSLFDYDGTTSPSIEEYLIDEKEDILNKCIKKEQYMFLTECLDILDNRKRNMILLNYGLLGDQMSQRAIADLYGISVSNAGDYIRRGITKIQEELILSGRMETTETKKEELLNRKQALKTNVYMTKLDRINVYKKISELQIDNNKTNKREVMLTLLQFGFLEGKCFSITSICKMFDITPKELNEMTNNVLINNENLIRENVPLRSNGMITKKIKQLKK